MLIIMITKIYEISTNKSSRMNKNSTELIIRFWKDVKETYISQVYE
jgi:hypothetical protein